MVPKLMIRWDDFFTLSATFAREAYYPDSNTFFTKIAGLRVLWKSSSHYYYQNTVTQIMKANLLTKSNAGTSAQQNLIPALLVQDYQ
jgi:hypothetical protein